MYEKRSKITKKTSNSRGSKSSGKASDVSSYRSIGSERVTNSDKNSNGSSWQTVLFKSVWFKFIWIGEGSIAIIQAISLYTDPGLVVEKWADGHINRSEVPYLHFSRRFLRPLEQLVSLYQVLRVEAER